VCASCAPEFLSSDLVLLGCVGVGAVWVGARVRAMVLQIGQLTQSLKAASDDAAIQVLCAQASLSLSLSLHAQTNHSRAQTRVSLSFCLPPSVPRLPCMHLSDLHEQEQTPVPHHASAQPPPSP
jgi:hypothetical protein